MNGRILNIHILLPCDGLDIVVGLGHLAEPLSARNQELKRGLRLLARQPDESLLVALGKARRLDDGGVGKVRVGVPSELGEVVGAEAVARQFLVEEADDLDLGHCGGRVEVSEGGAVDAPPLRFDAVALAGVRCLATGETLGGAGGGGYGGRGQRRGRRPGEGASLMALRRRSARAQRGPRQSQRRRTRCGRGCAVVRQREGQMLSSSWDARAAASKDGSQSGRGHSALAFMNCTGGDSTRLTLFGYHAFSACTFPLSLTDERWWLPLFLEARHNASSRISQAEVTEYAKLGRERTLRPKALSSSRVGQSRSP